MSFCLLKNNTFYRPPLNSYIKKKKKFIISFIKTKLPRHSMSFFYFFIRTYREFSNERTRVERQAKYYKMRTKKKYIDMFNTYINWITSAGI